MNEEEMAKVITEYIAQKRPGEQVKISFGGSPRPFLIKFEFLGGWKTEQLLPPGVPLQFTKGLDDHLLGIEITILPYDGLK